MRVQASSLQPGEPSIEAARDRPRRGAAVRWERHRFYRCRFAAFLVVQPSGEGNVTVGRVTVTGTTGVATGRVAGAGVAGTATGSVGTEATTLLTVSVGGLSAAEGMGDSCVVGAAAGRGVSEG
jgi:hypothetical protein